MLKEFWNKVFVKLWPMWVAGAILGISNAIFAILNGRVIGASGPWRSLTAWLETSVFGTNFFSKAGFSADLNIGIIALGMVLGSLIAALIAGDFKFRKTTSTFALKGFFGGVLIALGAMIAQGCSVFHLAGGIPAFSIASILVFAGIFLGVFIATKQVMRM